MKTFTAFVADLVVSASSTPGLEADEFGKLMKFDKGLPSVTPTSQVAILGNRNTWEGKYISVVGIVNTGLHRVLLFMSSELCKAYADQYAVLIDLDSIEPKVDWTELSSEQCKIATVHGRFFEFKKSKPKPNEIIIRDRPAW